MLISHQQSIDLTSTAVMKNSKRDGACRQTIHRAKSTEKFGSQQFRRALIIVSIGWRRFVPYYSPIRIVVIHIGNKYSDYAELKLVLMRMQIRRRSGGFGLREFITRI